jgi:hypothetical protein
MFRCERCGSSYSPMHAVAIENCPRCKVRDGISSPLAFKPFERHLASLQAPGEIANSPSSSAPTASPRA